MIVAIQTQLHPLPLTMKLLIRGGKYLIRTVPSTTVQKQFLSISMPSTSIRLYHQNCKDPTLILRIPPLRHLPLHKLEYVHSSIPADLHPAPVFSTYFTTTHHTMLPTRALSDWLLEALLSVLPSCYLQSRSRALRVSIAYLPGFWSIKSKKKKIPVLISC